MVIVSCSAHPKLSPPAPLTDWQTHGNLAKLILDAFEPSRVWNNMIMNLSSGWVEPPPIPNSPTTNPLTFSSGHGDNYAPGISEGWYGFTTVYDSFLMAMIHYRVNINTYTFWIPSVSKPYVNYMGNVDDPYGKVMVNQSITINPDSLKRIRKRFTWCQATEKGWGENDEVRFPQCAFSFKPTCV